MSSRRSYQQFGRLQSATSAVNRAAGIRIERLNDIVLRSVGRPVTRSVLPCGNINPLGITGTSVINPAAAIYFDAALARENGPNHEIFGLSLRDGAIPRELAR